MTDYKELLGATITQIGYEGYTNVVERVIVITEDNILVELRASHIEINVIGHVDECMNEDVIKRYDDVIKKLQE